MQKYFKNYIDESKLIKMQMRFYLIRFDLGSDLITVPLADAKLKKGFKKCVF